MPTIIRPWPILCLESIFRPLFQTSPICSGVKNALIRHFNVRSALHPISNQALSLWQLFTQPRWLMLPEFLQLFAPGAIHLAKVILVESPPSTSSLLAALFIFDQWRAGPRTIDGLLHLLIFSWTACRPNFTLIQHFHAQTVNFNKGTTCQTYLNNILFRKEYY